MRDDLAKFRENKRDWLNSEKTREVLTEFSENKGEF